MATPRICSVQDCGKPVYGRGWCKYHHQRWYRRGDPLHAPHVGKHERWIAEVALQHHSDECLLWPFGRGNYGYGETCVGERKFGAHRIVCERAHGPAPDGKNDAAHSCGCRMCVNPRHLRWASRKENADDMLHHGTKLIGEKHGYAKLTEANVREIRRLKGLVHSKELAERFGISERYVRGIQERRTWKHLN